MNVETFISFSLTAEDVARLESAVRGDVPPEALTPGDHRLHFRRGDAQLRVLQHGLDALGIRWRAVEERSFRDRELRSAPALRLCPGTSRAPTLVDYALERACPLCGQGREQVEDLVLGDPVEMEGGLQVTAEGQLLVVEGVARALVQRGITGGLLRGVRDPDGRARDVFQLQPTHTLPPAHCPPTRFELDRDAQCPLCRRGVLAVRSLLYYSMEVGAFADLNRPREEVGPAGGLVVSQRLFRLLRECGVQPLEVEPVMLI